MADKRRPHITARKRAWLDPDGTRVPGIAPMKGANIHAHLTPLEARKMADRLHDLADAAGNPEPKLPTTEAEREYPLHNMADNLDPVPNNDAR